MATTRRLLLVLGLMGLLAGDSLAAGAAPAPGWCDATPLAAEVATSCAAGAATLACCEAVVASVGLGGGDCLCAVAHETAVLHAGLNSASIIALYYSCGGARVVTACHGAQALLRPAAVAGAVAASSSAVAAARRPQASALTQVVAALAVATAPSSSATAGTAGRPTASPPAGPLMCNGTLLAKQIEEECQQNPLHNDRCCDYVVAAVELPACLCLVSEDLQNITTYNVVAMYRRCGAVQPIGDNVAASCYDSETGSSSPSPPEASSPPPPEASSPPPLEASSPPPSVGRWAPKDHIFFLVGMIIAGVELVLFGPTVFHALRKCCEGRKKKQKAGEMSSKGERGGKHEEVPEVIKELDKVHELGETMGNKEEGSDEGGGKDNEELGEKMDREKEEAWSDEEGGKNDDEEDDDVIKEAI